MRGEMSSSLFKTVKVLSFSVIVFSLFISSARKDKTFTVLNRENGDYVTTNSWKPLFMKIGNLKV